MSVSTRTVILTATFGFCTLLHAVVSDTNITANVSLNSDSYLFVDGSITLDGPVLLEGPTYFDDGGTYLPWNDPPIGTYWNISLQDGIFIWGSGSVDDLDLDFDLGDTVFFWYPRKTALRSVVATNESIDEANIVGDGSFAIGRYAIARGSQSIAMGNGAYGYNNKGIAIGALTLADSSAVSIGEGVETGQNAIAVGYDLTLNRHSVAFGSGNSAFQYAVSIGYQSSAPANRSLAIGYDCESTATAAATIGYELIANSYAMTALGAFNEPATSQSASTWVTTDQLFVVGNGVDDLSRSNAFVIYKNADAELLGDVLVEGTVTVASPGGDISMGSYGY